ncbi:MAG: type I restriction endonuclease subunit R [Paludibacteraceae bacterium]|nr:type I restriction endonuclease subunit R [Paludibacteraceae bacterium]
MSKHKFTEDSYEQALIALFRDELGYEYIYGPDIERDYRQPCYVDALTPAISRINPTLPKEAIDEALRRILHASESTLLANNEEFMRALQDGLEVPYVRNEEERTDIVQLIDYANYTNNTFHIANQWRVEGRDAIRCDMVVFVNGLPLVVVELKSPSEEGVTVHDAYLQIRNYQLKVPDLFTYNAFNVISDMGLTYAGTITADEERYMEWKSTDGEYEDLEHVNYPTFFKGIFPKERLLDIVRNFICFDHREGKPAKILAGYHQYFAVNHALKRTYDAVNGNGKIGVFWHTQGSGKSLSMVFLARLLGRHFHESTIVVVTDRNDLDDQLYGQFSRCADFLRQMPQQAGSKAELGDMLRDRKAGGIFFTTIQKFEEDTRFLSDRRNIIVMTDEAHRSQYGDTTFDVKELRTRKGYARLMREALPNASFIGFTGTPISDRDRDTQEVFGDYIDIYDMTQSVRDHATLPVYYESRAMKLKLDPHILEELDAEFTNLDTVGVTDMQLEKTKRKLSQLEEVLGAPETIDSLVKDIYYHYVANRQQVTTGKAMIVAFNRRIAMKIYYRLLALNPEWSKKVKVVMTGSNQDPEEWRPIVGNDAYRKELAKDFKSENSEMKIAIVVDMWLTGFDVPSLNTMYVYKPMSGHNLMQAIARVNRVFPEKEGGLIVDYIGIAQALKRAMKEYTARDQKKFGDPDIAKTALVTFKEKYEICDDLLHGFDYSAFPSVADAKKADLIRGAVNHILATHDIERRKDFLKESALMHNAVTLCRSLLSDEQLQFVAFFDAVRVLLLRLEQHGGGGTKAKEINERIKNLLAQSVQSEGVVVLFNDKEREFSLFNEAFLEDIKRMKEKNLAVEILKKLLQGVIGGYRHTNVVQSKKFSDMLSDSLSAYLKGMLSNEEVIEELIKLAKQIKQAEAEGNELGLSKEEKAFYDALTQPEMVRKAYSDEEFVALTKELTEELRKNRTIDWNKKESARAQMRTMVKRLLRKYNYPPEGQEQALEIVMEQCNQWADQEYYDAIAESGGKPIF